MQQYNDISECLIQLIINQFCCKKLQQEDKFNLRLAFWISFQFLLLLFWLIFALKGFRSTQDDGYPIIIFCCVSSYYIQQCEEKYIYHGIHNLLKRKKKLKVIDLIQDIFTIILLLLKRLMQDDNTLSNLICLIFFGVDSLLNVVELCILLKKKKESKVFSPGGTKSIYAGSLFGIIPAIILWIIYFPPSELFKFQSYNTILYVYIFSLLLILTGICFRIYNNKEGKYNPLDIKYSKQLLLFFYGVTQGFFQLIVAPINVVYLFFKLIFCKRYESVSQSVPIKTLET